VRPRPVIKPYMDGDAAANLLERRWFAAFKAASMVRAECEALLESMALSEAAWCLARARLCELEALRDALGAELEALDEPEDRIPAEEPSAVMSAA
jgi:hypothetical protein